MKTIQDDKTRLDLFNKPQVNDNHLPTTSTDYENNENILYEMSNGGIKVFPNFCISETDLDEKGILRVFYSRGTIIIRGRNLSELAKLYAAKKIAAIRVTPTNINTEKNENLTGGSSFSIDKITFEEN